MPIPPDAHEATTEDIESIVIRSNLYEMWQHVASALRSNGCVEMGWLVGSLGKKLTGPMCTIA